MLIRRHVWLLSHDALVVAPLPKQKQISSLRIEITTMEETVETTRSESIASAVAAQTKVRERRRC
jgi:hypothetical protein